MLIFISYDILCYFVLCYMLSYVTLLCYFKVCSLSHFQVVMLRYSRYVILPCYIALLLRIAKLRSDILSYFISCYVIVTLCYVMLRYFNVMLCNVTLL